jgi:hypothetical protein
MSRKITGMCSSMPGGTSQSAGAPGIPLPAAGTRTAFLSSVRTTHWSMRLRSRSASASVFAKN